MPLRVGVIHPPSAIEGGRLTLDGTGFPIGGSRLPDVRIGGVPARVVYASPTRLDVIVPPGITDGGPQPVRVDGAASGTQATSFVEVAAPLVTGVHQVDNPTFDAAGNLYVTYSGTRGEQVPVSIFRVHPDGTRETFSAGIVNPTSTAIGPDGQLYVSSRFEGVVYRAHPDGAAESFVTDLGVACGLAFAADGSLLVGDRSGTIFRVDRSGHATPFATLPGSIAAFHLTFGPDEALYVAGPTLSTHDAIYRIDADGVVTTRFEGFGRPQGLAFDADGVLFAVEALAGVSGLYRLPEGEAPELVLSGPGLIGVAFDPRGGLVVSSNDTVYRLPGDRRPFRLPG
ncbi:MAG TPA: IPT/TIG domain-containing protein [Vicinamibacterales bacterium]|jgi:sugar lactone lactonase YvrE|nr:IPT/TIG domain-containing protein [Vicinamibacterales bacterium]